MEHSALRYERAVRAALDSRRAPAALAAAAVLKRQKRFVAAAQLEEGVGGPLQRAADVAADANKVLRDLPVAGLDAGHLRALAESATQFFQHLAKVRAARHYPLHRAAKLVEAASAALAGSARRALDAAGGLLRDGPLDDLVADADAVFHAARQGVRRFRELAVEVGRRGGDVELRALASLDLEHEALERRVREAQAFRAEHAAFRGALAGVMAGPSRAAAPSLALAELDAALKRFRAEVEADGASAADASFEGDARWSAAAAEYRRRAARAEAAAAARMAADLDRARTADETFEVFAAFRPLLDRAPVRRAAQRRQAELVETARKSTAGFGAPESSYLGRISTDSARSWTRRELQAHPRRPPRIR